MEANQVLQDPNVEMLDRLTRLDLLTRAAAGAAQLDNIQIPVRMILAQMGSQDLLLFLFSGVRRCFARVSMTGGLLSPVSIPRFRSTLRPRRKRRLPV